MTDPCGIANGTSTTLSYIAETVQKTTPAGNFTTLRCNNPGGLGPQKTSIESEEVTNDRQDVDFRHGFESASGDINCEVIGDNADVFIAAAFGGAWEAPTYTGGALSGLGGGGASTENFGRTTSTWAADDFRIGDIVLVTTDTTNETECVVTDNTQDAGITLACATLDGENFPSITGIDSVELIGDRVSIGNADISTFSIERYHSDIDKAFNFRGVGVNTFALSAQPDAMLQMTFGLLGMAFDESTAVQMTLDAATTNSPITSNPSGGSVLIDGVVAGYVTGINFNLDNGRVAEPVIGSNEASCLQEGTANATGDVTLWLSDGVYWDHFKNEGEIAITYYAPDPDGNYINFVGPRAKLTDYSVEVNKNGAIPQTFNLKFLKDEVTGTTASIQGTWR